MQGGTVYILNLKSVSILDSVHPEIIFSRSNMADFEGSCFEIPHKKFMNYFR